MTRIIAHMTLLMGRLVNGEEVSCEFFFPHREPPLTYFMRGIEINEPNPFSEYTAKIEMQSDGPFVPHGRYKVICNNKEYFFDAECSQERHIFGNAIEVK